jgi:phosphatidylglycerophosphate synthase
LTALGVAGAGTVLAGYLMSWVNRDFLWLSVLGHFANWLGDSLDGSLARFRKIERPRYGFFLDHSVDAFCNFLIMLGFGATQYARLDVSLLALTGYFMLCMYVFLKCHVTGSFQLTFLSCGPTELRLGLVGLTISMFFFGAPGLRFGKEFFSVYDFILLGTSCGFFSVFVTQTWVVINRLRIEDTIPAEKSKISNSVFASRSPGIDIRKKLVDASKVGF